jgi:kynureninase
VVLSDLIGDQNLLAPYYSRFRVSERLLLTGHSHQAWPDISFEAQQQAWLDAAEFVDGKWEAARAQAERVKKHWKRLLNDMNGYIALGVNTHELVTRLLSALPLRHRPRLVATDAEFYTIRRLLARLREEGLEVLEVPVAQLAQSLNEHTACVLVSSVLYKTAEIVPGLDQLAEACTRFGTTLLIDAYHHVNAVPFDITAMGLDGAFIVGGGYKYCQLGEGNCFLRIPAGTMLRPILTGWFADFAGPTASSQFSGATYDPTSHYRAAAVFDFHVTHGLTPELLRQVSRHQVGLLKRLVQDLDIDPSIARIEPLPDERRAGFVALHSHKAAEISEALRRRGVLTDSRDDILRLGPAPYMTDSQLQQSILALAEVVR